MSATRKVVTRYAPSPTGPQHIGGVRTALFCYLFARHHGGELILRIEDTDQNRFVPGAEAFITEALNWLGISFDQGPHVGGPHAPYRQSERSELYQKCAADLLARGMAYYAFDTPEELEQMKKDLEAQGVVQPQYNYSTRMQMRNSLTMSAEDVQARIAAGEPYVIRFKVPPKEEIRFEDQIRGWVVIHSSHVDDRVMIKSDGLPTYHLANVVDDHFMGVTHVIRGEEWLSSTPLHVLLYRAFGWESTMPQFAHVPLFVNPDNSKMSKRNADKFGIPIYPMDWTDADLGLIKGYRGLGYLPEAIMNYIALLGWNPGNEQEILSREELIAAFSLERINKAPAKFDLDKLKHFQAHYLRKKTNAALLPLIQAEMEAAGIAPRPAAFMDRMTDLMRERVTFAADFVQAGRFFFEAPAAWDAQAVESKWTAEASTALRAVTEVFRGLESWTAAELEGAVKAWATAQGVKAGSLMMPLRLSITGVPNGPGTFDIAELIGREETLARMAAGCAGMDAMRGF